MQLPGSWGFQAQRDLTNEQTRKTKQELIDTDSSEAVTGGKEVAEGEGGLIPGERDELTLGGGHMGQYTACVPWSCTLETCVILLTNVPPTNLIKKRKGSKGPFFLGI